jgi:2-haloacid dehalogenase
MAIPRVKALPFDVFGTVVDWRGTVTAEGAALSLAKGWQADWAAFADDRRLDGYVEGMRRVTRGELPWMSVDALHRRKLDQLPRDRGLPLAEDEAAHLNLVWHRLAPWPGARAAGPRTAFSGAKHPRKSLLNTHAV